MLWRKGCLWIARQRSARRQRRQDRSRRTYAETAPIGQLRRFFPALPTEELAPFRAEIRFLSEQYLDHRFDLLGSGWTTVAPGIECRGREGYRYTSGPEGESDWPRGLVGHQNLAESLRIWNLVDTPYRPIDWQLDFISGYRWSEAIWYRDIRYGNHPGADVKVPWELGRMQHLPTLAWAFALSRAEADGFAEASVYQREFRNQVSDFIASNPPRFGVNWACTMDVAIRVANLLVAWDLFCACGARFSPDFEALFTRSVYEHGRHIFENLEWRPEFLGNHYLANLAGLVFVGAYLPGGEETDRWLCLGLQELLAAVEEQFDADGANFEASTCYHGLSAELVIYGAMLAMAVPKERYRSLAVGRGVAHPVLKKRVPPPSLYPNGQGGVCPLPPWFVERVEAMALFTIRATRPDGLLTQFGDNDSGRFFKLFPVGKWYDAATLGGRFLNLGGEPDGGGGAGCWVEESLDHRHLVAGANSLCMRQDFEAFAGELAVITRLLRQVAGGRVQSNPDGVPAWGGDNCTGAHGYSGFGAYFFSTPRFYLAVRCGGVGQNGFGGHAHDDQLSFELVYDRVPFIVDPGTYLYTAVPAKRREFRSAWVHSTLAVAGKTQNGSGTEDLFQLRERAHARVRQWTPGMIEIEHKGFGLPHRRVMELTPEAVIIADRYAGPEEKTVHFTLAPGVQAELIDGGVLLSQGGKRLSLLSKHGRWSLLPGAFSRGYGWAEETVRVVLSVKAERQAWDIAIRLGEGTID